MSENTSDMGKRGEELAAAYLESKGYTVLDRNYFFQRAEVDIVARGDDCIVFAEVKFRSGTDFGRPEESVSRAKIRNIYKAAEAWIHERKMDGAPVRFDVVAIVQAEGEAPNIRHHENAFHLDL